MPLEFHNQIAEGSNNNANIDIEELLNSEKFHAHDYIEDLCEEIYKLYADETFLNSENIIFSIYEKLSDKLKDISEIKNSTLDELKATEMLYMAYNKENSTNFLKIFKDSKNIEDEFMECNSRISELSESFDELYDKIKVHMTKNVKASHTMKILKLLEYITTMFMATNQSNRSDQNQETKNSSLKSIESLDADPKDSLSNICQTLNINIYTLFEITSFLIANEVLFQELNQKELFKIIAKICEYCYEIIEEKLTKAYDNKLYSVVRDCSQNIADYILYESTLRKLSDHVIENEFAKFDLNHMTPALKQLSLWVKMVYQYFKYPKKMVHVFFRSLFITKIYTFIDFKSFENPNASQLHKLILFSNNFKIFKEFMIYLRNMRQDIDLALFDDLMSTDFYQENIHRYLKAELEYFKDHSDTVLIDFYHSFCKNNQIKYDPRKDLNSTFASISYSYSQTNVTINESLISINCCRSLISNLINLLKRIQLMENNDDVQDIGLKAMELFKTYLIDLHIEKGLDASLRYDYNRSRKSALKVFVSLSCIQTVGKVIKSMLMQVGEQCIKELSDEIRVSFVRVTNEQVLYLGNILKHSLKKFFAIYRTSLQNILLSNQISLDFLTNDLFSSSTKACQQANDYIENIVSQFKNSISQIPNQRDILSKLGYLTFEILVQNIKNFKYTCMGAAQLNCDIKEYQNVAKIFECPKIMNFFDSLTCLTVILLVSPENLESVLEDDQLNVFNKNLLIAIRRLRKDRK